MVIYHQYRWNLLQSWDGGGNWGGSSLLSFRNQRGGNKGVSHLIPRRAARFEMGPFGLQGGGLNETLLFIGDGFTWVP